ncbi:mid region of cactin-domain-containing protein [Phakopsora pachyrhizi]|uniref:Splicing factor Cactin n=1 Tax=Phakopsora pachyrhizi TaxID=170000 RepID=A0AAV0AXX7_PHAPC|nr:mid region of cactin-domain-containing protein [Phakopsora pachyrhizi]CAH7673796.1 mid region of cactin-domain-containing protein [Phakopsora pachyrhizi]
MAPSRNRSTSYSRSHHHDRAVSPAYSQGRSARPEKDDRGRDRSYPTRKRAYDSSPSRSPSPPPGRRKGRQGHSSSPPRWPKDQSEFDKRNSRSRSPSRQHHSSNKKKRETSSERRDRKKKEKSARKLERRSMREEADRRAAAELSMYSAVDNPFHDANLSSRFEWVKKRERERKLGISPDEASRREAERRAEAAEELERLAIRRAEREKELELREAESSRMAQMAESAQMAEWIAKEDDFQLEQAQKRAEIRVREKRAKPIDLLALNLKWGHRDLADESTGVESDDHVKKKSLGALIEENGDDEDDGIGLEVDLDEPYTIFDNLSLEETQELAEDIKMHIALEKSSTKLEFWRCLQCVCNDALSQLQNERTLQHDSLRAGAAVRDEITRLLQGKSYDKLIELESNIESKLTGNEPIDPEYWESLLAQLKVWKAKAKLKGMHEVVLRNRLEHLRRRQRDEAVKIQAELASTLPYQPNAARLNHGILQRNDTNEVEHEDIAEDAEDLPEVFEKEMNPMPLAQLSNEDQKLDVLLPYEDWNQIINERQMVLSTRFVPKIKPSMNPQDQEIMDRDALAEKLYAQEAEKGLAEAEEVFELEAETGRQSYNWEDKYRPRKPRYFNKVHTGYEWNKYNQTHYDTDNPPPKVVQGYKFNIFYPDLIDKSRAPTYKIIKNKENEDVATLLFKAGPPYEDIAFTIVNKDWEHSHKRGFRSSFDRGVLQLHFTLKRVYYRK